MTQKGGLRPAFLCAIVSHFSSDISAGMDGSDTMDVSVARRVIGDWLQPLPAHPRGTRCTYVHVSFYAAFTARKARDGEQEGIVQMVCAHRC
ncbi:hypothetical protein KWG_0100755 [Xanthomonas vasicola pv. vasculorum NCPPB 1381]|nr:hypothetical protein KWG_0100755 [Xanthomonas vasicola pv. vasculorum NCPPB 1381]